MKNFLILVFLFIAVGGFSQNLVPNPSFEDTVMCPDGGGDVVFAEHWQVFRETPDYFNSCASDPLFSTPYNHFGYQIANNGVAYMGLYTVFNDDYKEIIGVRLNEELEIGKKYFISFKAVLSYNGNGISTCYSNNIGALFTTEEYSLNNPMPINNYSHINKQELLNDSINWSSINGSFIADSAYKYIAIGNFFDIAHTDTVQFQYPGKAAYYYIDDVCVSTDSNDCKYIIGYSLEINNTNSLFYYDEKNGSVNYNGVDNKMYHIEIRTADGKLIFKNEYSLLRNKQSMVSVPPNELLIIQYKTKQTTMKFQKILTIKN
jgi:hypothetical protein